MSAPALTQPNNGWALYEPKYIEGGMAKNIHIVEAIVRTDGKGSTTSQPNDSRLTMCGRQRLVLSKRQCILATTSANEIRSEICRLQNGGQEICGQCAARFYADLQA